MAEDFDTRFGRCRSMPLPVLDSEVRPCHFCGSTNAPQMCSYIVNNTSTIILDDCCETCGNKGVDSEGQPLKNFHFQPPIG